MTEPTDLMEYIKEVLRENKDSWNNVRAIWITQGYGKNGKRIDKKEARRIFKNEPAGSGYGGEECTAFHIYTRKNLLFMGCYDGSEWIQLMPLNISKPREVSHVGGG